MLLKILEKLGRKKLVLDRGKSHPDYKNAKVYVTQLNDDTSPEKTIDYLSNKATYFKSNIAISLRLRTIPRLNFIYDDSIQRALYLNKLIEGLSPDDHKSENVTTKRFE